MANIQLRLSDKINDNGLSEIGLRYKRGREVDIMIMTGLFISPSHFEYYINKTKTTAKGIKLPKNLSMITKEEADKKGYILLNRGEVVVRNRLLNEDKIYHDRIKAKLDELISVIAREEIELPVEKTNREWLKNLIERFIYDENYVEHSQENIIDLLNAYISESNISTSTIKLCKIYIASYKRFCQYNALKNNKINYFSLSNFDQEAVKEYLDYTRKEYDLFCNQREKYKEIFGYKFNLSGNGINYIANKATFLRSFNNWLLKKEIVSVDKLKKMDAVRTLELATPYYLTLEERDYLFTYEFKTESFQRVRDMFILQCLIGCRFSDLIQLKHEDVNGNFIEYIPQKTSHRNARVVRVPLVEKAKNIIEFYKGNKSKYIFKKMSIVNYNVYIKKIFKEVGLSRYVTIVDTITGKDIRKPLYEVASSHLARRTFIGNLYKAVHDPNLIASMSGHVEGSKAFARYRTIDDEIKQDVIKGIE